MSENLFLYVIGVPGSGKTSALKMAIGDIPGSAHGQPFAHIHYPGGYQLGAERGTFSGTDALSMSVQPKVLTWLADTRPSVVVAEGDRLANHKFFRAVQVLGYDLTVALIDVSPAVAQTRCASRGSTQGMTWMRGRWTKVAGLASTWVSPQWWLPGDRPLEDVAGALARHPAIRALWLPDD